MRSGTYRPIFRQFFWVFAIVCVGLGYLGSKPAEGGYVFWSRILTAYYFLHFIVILPLLGLLESPKPLAVVHFGRGAGEEKAFGAS